MQFLENLWKIWENIDILNLSERRRNYLVSEPNYHTAEFFTEHLLVIEMKKTDILMNQPVCLGLSIVLVWFCETEIWWRSKIVLYGYR